jgi:hypothetical protein
VPPVVTRTILLMRAGLRHLSPIGQTLVSKIGTE